MLSKTDLRKIDAVEQTMATMDAELLQFKKDYLANDKVIDATEQKHLDELEGEIRKIFAKLQAAKAALPPEITLEQYRSSTYHKANYIPPVKISMFDVSLDPKTGIMEVVCKVKFAFKTHRRGQSAKNKENPDYQWTPAEKKEWQEDFIKLATERWSGKFSFVHPDLAGVRVAVRVSVVAVDSGWHFETTVVKSPTHDRSFVQYPEQPNKQQPETLKVTLHSKDLEEHAVEGEAHQHHVGVHEQGHMLAGLDDQYAYGEDGRIRHNVLVRNSLGIVLEAEYSGDDLMEVGNQVRQHDYVGYWQALRDVTGLIKWKFER